MIDWLRIPEIKFIKDLDAPESTLLHQRIIHKKPFLKKIYIDFYNQLKELIPDTKKKKMIVELGSGGGFIKDVIPNIITSDINKLPILDIDFSVFNMPFKDNTIDIFLLLNVFHHVNNPLVCLKEMSRCLKISGRILMIEPANTLWRRFIDKRFHHEKFDVYAGWETEGTGPLSAANGALPWIIFCRDRSIFKDKFPSLKIKNIKLHNNFRYIISGGLTYRQLLPLFTYNIVKGLEIIVSPLKNYFGYFQTIELEKI